MKKVVRIIGRMNGGGPARQVAYLHHALRNSCETVLLIGTVDEGEQDMRYLLKDTTGVIEIPSMSRSVKALSDLISLIKITRILLREKPDIVHTHTAKAGVLGRVAARIARVPVTVHTYHGNVFQGYFSERASRLIVAIERALNRITTRVVVVSETQAEELISKFKVARSDQVVIIRNGFDLKGLAACSELRQAARRKWNFRDEDFVVVWAGRLAAIKNVPLLLEVAHKSAHIASAKFLVVGDGPFRTDIEALSGSLPNFRFIGWQNDMLPIWAAADMALLTSRNEGTPTSLIEASAAGKPFVSTEVGGVLDLVKGPLKESSDSCKQAANGFLCSANPEVLAGCIEKLATSPALAEQMGTEGRGFAFANYDQGRLAFELNDLYEKLLKRARIPAQAQSLANPVGRSANN